MSLQTQVSATADLVICLDFTDPESYLALAASQALVNDLGLTVQWLPLEAGLGRISSRPPQVSDDPQVHYKARRALARQKNAEAELRRTCELLDIPLANSQPQFDASSAAMGLLYVNAMASNAPQYIEGIYEGIFRQGDPVATVVTQVLSGLGIDLASWRDFTAGPGPVVLQQLADELLLMGVFGSPGYLYRGERFQGRQHLPLLRWYLTGGEGAAPV
ncbi:MAG: DsbA family protein [SAR86 cluster bacterium]|mgnify:CR=1 FL=1|uniref:DsbA family protein n=1 Tax=SAR86 cluster bacterium TaxID=2030880 RepID=A0A972VTW4_9GAMM|nr:DsbA family protein [SAR86 cluster bacterium]